MEQAARGSYICLDMRSGYSLLLVLGCHSLDRDNPVDPVVTHGVRGEGAGLSLIVPCQRRWQPSSTAL